MDKVSGWTAENRMILNSSKTKSMLEKGKRMKNKLPSTEHKIRINGNEIGRVNSQKLLGVKLDEELNFNDIIDDSRKLDVICLTGKKVPL